MAEKSAPQKVIIIGSGPAGYTAALYAARATLAPVVFEGSAPNLPGGQLMLTSEVENYPGFPEGLMGPLLMDRFKEQSMRFGAQIEPCNIQAVDFSARPFKVDTDDGRVFYSHTVIIATGANAKLIGIPLEKELMANGAGVSACATCDGAFYKNVNVAVVGGGDSAMEEAIFLTRYANSVTIVHRRDFFRASKIMLERAQKNPKITFLTNYQIDSLLTEKKPPRNQENLSGLSLKHSQTGQKITIQVEGLFVAIGHEPNTALFKKALTLDEKGYIKTRPRTSETEIPGVFACGDVQDSVYRQAVTAAGTGCMAALDAERFLGHLDL